MTAVSYIESIQHLPIEEINQRIECLSGIREFFDCRDDITMALTYTDTIREDKDEFGDWQTNMELALSICKRLKNNGVSPKVVLEPTCGCGNFILAVLQTFDGIEDIYGVEIHKPHIQNLKLRLLQYCIENKVTLKVNLHLWVGDVFQFDFESVKQTIDDRELLVIGNPPWVTNSKMSSIKGQNIPRKSNFKHNRGIEAITGKGNFDIGEYICLMMVRIFSTEKAHIALLLKNSVIRNILYEQKKENYRIKSFIQYKIDALKEFGASVSASLLLMECGLPMSQSCGTYDFYSLHPLQKYGWVDNRFVADTSTYEMYKFVDGVSPLQWRSGVKHDCTKVMELTLEGDHLVNGYGKIVDIEPDVVYPLVKSSDIKGVTIASTKRYVIITQHSTKERTEELSKKCPKTYKYLLEYADMLDARKSSIYKDRPRFCMFGIGEYSFKKYKVVVSGLYKHANFSLIEPIGGKPVMVDDTCYQLGFDVRQDAVNVQRALNSFPIRCFINSLSFVDAKRMINKELLMRIDWPKLKSHELTLFG